MARSLRNRLALILDSFSKLFRILKPVAHGIGITKDVSFLRIDHSASTAILFGVRQAAQNSSTERKDVRQ